MPTIVIIKHEREVSLGAEWVDATKCKSLGWRVDDKGNRVGQDYTGRAFKIILKKERPFSALERLVRKLIGIALILLSFGLLYCLNVKPVMNLVTKTKETIRYAIANPLIQSMNELTDEVILPNIVEESDPLLQKLQTADPASRKELITAALNSQPLYVANIVYKFQQEWVRSLEIMQLFQIACVLDTSTDPNRTASFACVAQALDVKSCTLQQMRNFGFWQIFKEMSAEKQAETIAVILTQHIYQASEFLKHATSTDSWQKFAQIWQMSDPKAVERQLGKIFGSQDHAVFKALVIGLSERAPDVINATVIDTGKKIIACIRRSFPKYQLPEKARTLFQ